MKDPQKVILFPLTTEKAVRLVESQNTITFVVAPDANKHDIKRAVEILYGVKVKDVRTVKTPDGKKKAYVRLREEFSADELAAKLGVI
jgi:large subunit ribosomal protein L23